ncbi:hypothetical protein Cylst_1485 [Cylindrospermum stagnale PCC 7417]|uniref:Uncharacterized protein n=1 Tax=Cylindrospermum stagnale PCC 7417 TaxID=56107 RepID=K9WVC7_9NOST|nr:hypothetical protein [Cylindrospermum stagnale]AFZ23769.1 hypothetical protein Cylst_1485 [Cylindrospermum stagnale PCC 7417]
MTNLAQPITTSKYLVVRSFKTNSEHPDLIQLRRNVLIRLIPQQTAKPPPRGTT